MFIELYSNYTRNASGYAWTMDSLFTIILIVTFILTFSNLNIKILTIPFGVLVLILLAISWVNQGGIYGRSEYNYMGLVIALAMVNTGRDLRIFLVLALAIVTILNLVWEFRFEWLESYIVVFYELPLHYVSILIIATVFVYYLRHAYEKEQNELESKSLQLSRSSMELDIENAKLISQHKEYARVNAQLEAEIKERRIELDSQNKSLREFIEVSLNEFYPPLDLTLSSIDDLKEKNIDNENFRMLLKSRDVLEKAYESLRSKMKRNLK